MKFWTGVAVGAAAMYFLDPVQGDQRRAMAREKYERLRPTVTARVEAAEPTIRGLGERVRGAAERVPMLRVLRGGKQDETPSVDRPAIMRDLTATQMEELTRQFGERDRQSWNNLASGYGWTAAQADEVWRWFEERPAKDQATTAA
jgi:hypothetical protein